MRILVAGSFASPPGQGGATWAVLQYALGFRELGHEVVLVDPCRRDDAVLEYFDGILRAGQAGTALLVHPDRSTTGEADYDWLAQWSARADVLVNLAGVLRDEELTGPIPHRIYVDLDPGFTQLWATAGIDMGFSGHHRFATVGQRVGTDTSTVPTCGRDWHPTLPPVVLSDWPSHHQRPSLGWTTVANWRSYGSISVGGVHYGQKAHSIRGIIDLPARVGGTRLQPALAIDDAETADLDLLDAHGWKRIDPRVAAGSPIKYRWFVAASTAELGAAKSGYVVSRSGWFSDRSACYLASARPVVAQDTGWTDVLPSDEGLLSYSGAEDAAEGIGRIHSDYRRHARAARAVACEHFDSRLVLPRLLGLPSEKSNPSPRRVRVYSRRVPA